MIDLSNEKLVAVDIETSNGRGAGVINPKTPGASIALTQLTENGSDITLHRWHEAKPLLQKYQDEGYRFIIHFTGFELYWWLHFGLRITKVWDTMLASQLIHAGRSMPDEASMITAKKSARSLQHLGKWKPIVEEDDENFAERREGVSLSHSLAAVVYRYTGASIQKDQATSDWSGTLSEEQVRYAKDDVRYLHAVALAQWKKLKDFGMERVTALEMELAPVVADMRYRGIQIEVPKWRKQAQEYLETADTLEQELNLELGRELAERSGDTNLFGVVIPRAFKVSSTSQLTKFFGTEKSDVAELKKINHPQIPKILAYKEAVKIASTYGEKFLGNVDEETRRIHTRLLQADTATGRFSSREPNCQNIPPKMLKEGLTCDPDKILVFADYSAMESRILAYLSGDKGFIGAVESGDIHSENARKIFNIPKDQPVPPELRRKAKGLTFGVPYGISALGLVNRGFASDIDEAEHLLSAFYEQYPVVEDFLRESRLSALLYGYNQNPLGRVRWYDLPKPGTMTKEEQKKVVRAVERQAQNFKIQSTSADVTKQALVDLYRYLTDGNFGYIILTVHDSVIFEIYRNKLDEVLPNIKAIMVDAGQKIFPGLITPVDIEVSKTLG